MRIAKYGSPDAAGGDGLAVLCSLFPAPLAAVVAVILVIVVANPAAAGSGNQSPQRTDSTQTAHSRPLERLRLRSAFERWQKIKQQLQPAAEESAGNETAVAEQSGNARPAIRFPESRQAIRSISEEPVALPIADIQPVTEQDRESDSADQSGTRSSVDYYVETPIQQILPYFDYEPLRIGQREKDCLTFCPCAPETDCRKPDGKTAKTCPCPEDDIKRPWIEKMYQPREFEEDVVTWDPANIYSYPLYFEDVVLERYGHTYHPLLQPFVSVGRFAGQLAFLPYQMTINPARQRMYALGYYRPGEWAPKLHYQIPWNSDAALTEAGVVTGLFFIFP